MFLTYGIIVILTIMILIKVIIIIITFIIFSLIWLFALADLIPIFTHMASHNKWPKVYGFIVHLLCFQIPAPSCTFTFFLTCSVLGTISLPISMQHIFFLFQMPPDPVSSNLIFSLKPSLIYELSPSVLFSAVMLRL